MVGNSATAVMLTGLIFSPLPCFGGFLTSGRRWNLCTRRMTVNMRQNRDTVRS